MTHPIDAKLDLLQKRARRLARWFGLCAFLSVVLAAVLCIAWLDQTWRYSDRISRYVGFVAFILVSGLALRYLLLPSFLYRPDRLRLAVRLESLFPSLRDRLSSAIAFLDAGSMKEADASVRRSNESVALRQAVIGQADEVLGQIPWLKSLNASATLVAASLAIVSLVVFLTWSLFDTESSRIAIHRNLAPWAAVEWPKRNQLSFDPVLDVVKRGSTIEFRVIDRKGRLPERVELEVVAAERDRAVVYEMSNRDEEAICYIDNVQQDIMVRASGGDDQTEWSHIRVVNAPQIESLEITIEPPEYLSIESLTTSGSIRAWKGSLITWHGRVDRPVESVTLVIDTPEATRRLALQLDPTQTSFHLPEPRWKLEVEGSYQLELVDGRGVSGELDSPMLMRILEDDPPSVSIELNAWQQVSTVRGLVSFGVRAIDDVHLNRGQITVASSNTVLMDQTVELTGDQSNLDASIEGADNPTHVAVQPDGFAATRKLRLSQFQQLQPGDELQFQAVFEDDLGQVGQHEPITLSIVTDDEYLERLSGLELFFQQRIGDAYESQLRSIEWVESLQLKVNDLNAFLTRIDELDATQQQVGMQLGEGSDGASRLARDILQWLQTQQLHESQLGLRTEAAWDELQQLRRSALPEIQAIVDGWLVAGELRPEQGISSNRLLEDCHRLLAAQHEVAATLSSLLESLGKSQRIRSLIEELRDIRINQEEFSSDLSALHVQYLKGELESRQIEVEQTESANRQGRIADRLDAILVQLTSLTEQSKTSSDELVRLVEVLDLAERLQVVGAMRDVSLQIRDSRLGRAIVAQDYILDALARLLAAARASDSASAMRIQAITDAQRLLSGAINQQKAIAADLEKQRDQRSDTNLASDWKRQIELQQQAVHRSYMQVSDRLESIGREQLPQRLRNSADTIQRSVNSILAEFNEASLQAVQDQIETLDAINRELQREIDDRTTQQFTEELEQWVARLQRLDEQQSAILEAVSILQSTGSAATEQGELDLDRLRKSQSQLLTETREVAQQSSSMPTLSPILQQIATEMERAERGLDLPTDLRRSTSAMLNAQSLIREVLEAFQPKPLAEETTEPSDNGEAKEPPKNARSASLRTIRILQNFVYEQTAELERRLADGGMARSREDYQRLGELAKTQRLLLEMVREMKIEFEKSIESAREARQGESPGKSGSQLQIPLPGIDR